MSIKQWIFSSLRTKLVFMFVILTATPLVFVGLVSYKKSFNTVSDHAIALAVLEAERINRDIELFLQETIKFAEIGDQESVITFLTTPSETYEEAKHILATLDLYRKTYKFSVHIFDIHIVNYEGKAISENKGVYHQTDASLQFFDGLGPQIHMTPQAYTPGGRQGSISISNKITWDITNEVIGLMIIDLNPAIIEDYLEQATLGTNGRFHIQDESGDMLFPLDHSRTSTVDNQLMTSEHSGHFTTPVDAQDTFIIYNTLDLTNWKVVGQVPVGEIMKEANDIRSLIIITVVCSIVFTITLYYFISARLIRPINHLKETMRLAASGNLDVKVWDESTDEIADLGASFNVMLKRIKMLMEKNLAEQERLKQAELRTMQAQINPHFLYNTLDTIVWMAEAKKSEEVINITKALSHFFRLTLSKGQDWITLRDEIDHIRNYLMIQKLRYRDILDVEFIIDDQILPHTIFKLTLQPLVENAIYHGIKNKRGKGLIRIKGEFNSSGDIIIHIIDNGIGIAEQKLHNIHTQLYRADKQQTSDADADISFGIDNVHRRIRLYYGEPYGLQISSRHGFGTHVSVMIPAER